MRKHTLAIAILVFSALILSGCYGIPTNEMISNNMTTFEETDSADSADSDIELSNDEDLVAENAGMDLSAYELKPVDIGDFIPDEDLSADDIKRLNNGDVEIVMSPDTGWLRSVKGRFSTREIYNTEDAVKALASLRSIMNIDQLSFTCREEEVNDYENTKVYYLQQLYKNIRVVNSLLNDADIRMSVKSTGEPCYISGKYKPGLNMSIIPQITAEEAAEIIVLYDGSRIKETALVIYAIYGSSQLCWKFTIEANWRSDEEYCFVDANTGVFADVSLPSGFSEHFFEIKGNKSITEDYPAGCDLFWNVQFNDKTE